MNKLYNYTILYNNIYSTCNTPYTNVNMVNSIKIKKIIFKREEKIRIIKLLKPKEILWQCLIDKGICPKPRRNASITQKNDPNAKYKMGVKNLFKSRVASPKLHDPCNVNIILNDERKISQDLSGNGIKGKLCVLVTG